MRFCVDYRKVKTVTRKDPYPLPCVDDTLDTLVGSQWFSTLSGYWKVVHPEDCQKRAFCTPVGLFHFKVMLFGVCSTSATFQRLVDTVLTGLQWINCLVYLNDVIILGRTFDEHLTNLKAVFDQFREAGLKFKPLAQRQAPLGTIRAGYPIQIVAVDIMSSLPETETGNSDILVAGDYYIRWMEAYPIPN